MRRAGVLAIDDLMEIFRVSDISWFHFVHFARSLIMPPSDELFCLFYFYTYCVTDYL